MIESFWGKTPGEQDAILDQQAPLYNERLRRHAVALVTEGLGNLPDGEATEETKAKILEVAGGQAGTIEVPEQIVAAFARTEHTDIQLQVSGVEDLPGWKDMRQDSYGGPARVAGYRVVVQQSFLFGARADHIGVYAAGGNDGMEFTRWELRRQNGTTPQR